MTLLSGEPVLLQHPGRVGQDGLDLLLGDAELAGYLLDGCAAGQVLKDGVQGQSGVAEGPGPGQPFRIALYAWAVAPVQCVSGGFVLGGHVCHLVRGCGVHSTPHYGVGK